MSDPYNPQATLGAYTSPGVDPKEQDPKAPSPILTLPPQILYKSSNVDPTAVVYMSNEDNIAFQYASDTIGEIITIVARVLRPDGTIVIEQFALPVPTAFLQQTFQNRLGEGFLLSLTAQAGTATFRGETFVRAFLNRGKFAPPVQVSGQVLLCDYCTRFYLAAWPGGPISYPGSPPGFLTSNVPANPSAGAEISVTLSNAVRWKIRSLQFQLTASATVANRQPRITIQTGAHGVWQAGATVNITAGQTVVISCGPLNAYVDIAGTDFVIPIPDDLWLSANGVIATNTLGLQAGDQYSAIGINIEQLLDGI